MKVTASAPHAVLPHEQKFLSQALSCTQTHMLGVWYETELGKWDQLCQSITISNRMW